MSARAKVLAFVLSLILLLASACIPQFTGPARLGGGPRAIPPRNLLVLSDCADIPLRFVEHAPLWGPELPRRISAVMPPEATDPGSPFRMWLTWESNHPETCCFELWEITTRVSTSLGEFEAGIVTNMLVFSPQAQSTGALVCLRYDPAKKRETDFSPLQAEEEAILRIALENGVLTPQQMEVVEDQLTEYQGRYREFAERWELFRRNPDEPGPRDGFLEALFGLEDGIRALADTRTFYTREQRVALRRLGCTIEGDAYGGEQDGVRETNLRDYPIGEFVARWNTMPQYLHLSRDRPRLRVEEGHSYDEMDLTLVIDLGKPPAEQIVKVLEAISVIPGLEVTDQMLTYP